MRDWLYEETTMKVKKLISEEKAKMIEVMTSLDISTEAGINKMRSYQAAIEVIELMDFRRLIEILESRNEQTEA